MAKLLNLLEIMEVIKAIPTDIIYARLIITVISPVVALLLIVFISVIARFFLAKNEKITSWLIAVPAIIAGALAALFFRFDQADFLYSHLFFYQQVADSIVESANAYFPLYSFSSSLIAVIAALLIAAILAIKSGFGLEWQKRGAKILGRQKTKIGFSNKKLKFGKIIVPAEIETRGFAIFGSTGTGKSQVFIRTAETARKRGQRAIVVDPDGELMSRFFREGDKILNPEDERSENWSIFADLKNKAEADNFAEAIIEKGKGESESWHSSARRLIAALLEKLIEKNNPTTREMLHLALLDDLAVMSELVKGTEARRVMEGTNTKSRDSMITIISQSLRPWWRLVQEAGSDGFSLREWIRNEESSSWLWMPYSSPESASTAPLRRTWLSILLKELTALGEDSERRIWLFLDEFHESGQLDFLPSITARGRKYGLVHCLGIHSISQIRSVYGNDDAQTMMATTGNKILLRAADPETAKYQSEQIGDRETERKERSQSKGETGRSENLGYHREITPEVLPSELMNLKDLNGYILLAGSGYFRLKLEFLGSKFPQIFEWKKAKKILSKIEEKKVSETKKIKLKKRNDKNN